jgi:Ca2+-binding RTX toxin-like protein
MGCTRRPRFHGIWGQFMAASLSFADVTFMGDGAGGHIQGRGKGLAFGGEGSDVILLGRGADSGHWRNRRRPAFWAGGTRICCPAGRGMTRSLAARARMCVGRDGNDTLFGGARGAMS